MDKQDAAQILIECSLYNEDDPELTEALKLGAQALQKDDLKWVPKELRDWLFDEPPYLDEVNLGC